VGDASAMAGLSGYVQQDDIFIGTLTVAEHLWLMAMLRMDRHLSKVERQEKVDEVVNEVCVYFSQFRRFIQQRSLKSSIE